MVEAAEGGDWPSKECKSFGESNLANFDCDSSDVDRCESEGFPGSIPTAPTNIFFSNSELQICEGA